jgi:spermidine synthase
MKSRLLPGAGLVFGSGLSALLYQTTWLREFRLIFGSSTAASAAVVGIFMGGLGLGSALLGPRAEKTLRPLAFYARLEFGIAASAALTPTLIWLVRAAYIACGGTLTMGTFAGTCVRLLLAAGVLGVPTLLMGGTLPAMARFAVSDECSGKDNDATESQPADDAAMESNRRQRLEQHGGNRDPIAQSVGNREK